MVPKCFVALTIVLFLVWCSREHPIHRVLRIWLRHLQSHENRSPTQHPLKAIGVGCHGRRGQEKTYRNSVDNKQFWTESKAVVGFKHTIDRHSFLSPTSQTKKNTDCQFQSLYLKTCLCWTCRNCHEGLLCDLGMFLSVSLDLRWKNLRLGTWPRGARQRIVVGMWTSPATSPTLWWHPLRGSKN